MEGLEGYGLERELFERKVFEMESLKGLFYVLP
jgi:hypothetical protein